MKTGRVIRLTLLTALAGAAVFATAWGTGFWHARGAERLSPPETYGYTAEELYSDLLSAGWRVKHPPGLPGPYRKRLPGILYYHSEDSSSTVRLRDRAGVVYWKERTRPGVEFHTIVLETLDGQRTEGLLVRGE